MVYDVCMGKVFIGLVGPIASGKQVLADYLKDLGFEYFSLSDQIRIETRQRGLSITRENLQNVGNSLRAKFGNEVLARRAMMMFDHDMKMVVIDSIRNYAEVEYLRKHLPIKIIGVDAPAEIRLERFLARAKERHEDGLTADEFWKANARDRGENIASGQQVDICLLATDIVIENPYSTKGEFLDICKTTIEQIRPSLFVEGGQKERLR